MQRIRRQHNVWKPKSLIVIMLILVSGYVCFIHPETSTIVFSQRPMLSKTLLLGQSLLVLSAQGVWNGMVLLWKASRYTGHFALDWWARLSGNAPTYEIRSRQELYQLYHQVERWSGLPWQIFWGLHAEETNLGQNLGRVRVLTVLPEGQKPYFLRMCRELHWDPEQVYGSHKGAIGPFQFIPETWVRHAVDGNGDGRKDPFNIEDAAYSAANYLLYKGGQENLQKALWHYNQDASYVKRVMRYLRYS